MFEAVKLYLSQVWSFLRPFLRLFLSRLGPVLAESAMAAVRATAEAMTGASGEEKRVAAYQAAAESLRQQGVTIGVDVTTSMINAALEAAVQKLKAEAGT